MPLEKQGGGKVTPQQAKEALDEPEEEIDEEEVEDDGEIETDITPGNYVVQTPAGAELSLMTPMEVQHYNDLSARYQSDNLFRNISDLLELDRILTMEIMCFRWAYWLLSEKDYWGDPVNVSELQKQHREYGKMILELKQGLGLDKKSRDANNAGTVADFIENLKVRAKEFGIHRDEQNYMAYNLLRELEGKVTLMRNASETEKTEFEAHASQIFNWFVDEVIPKLDGIDEHFRENQRIWIREEFQN